MEQYPFFKNLNHLEHNININFINCNYSKNKEKKKGLIKKKLKNISKNLFKKKILNSKSFIISTYLNKIDELKLLYLFKQPPIFLENEFDYEDTNVDIRQMLKKKLKSNEDSEIEKIIKNLIIDIFPNIYLESFNNLKKN